MYFHKWTEDEDDFLRTHYKQTHQSAQEIGKALNIPWGVVRARCGVLGICKRTGHTSERRWSVKEDQLLKELIHRYSIATISNMMGRSINSIKIRATRLKYYRRSREEWFTKQECCEILGVDHKRMQTYIDRGYLKASYHNGRKPGKAGLTMWHIEQTDLRDFVRQFCHEFTGRNVDLTIIVHLFDDLGKPTHRKYTRRKRIIKRSRGSWIN